MGKSDCTHVKLNSQLQQFVVDFDLWSKLASTDPESFERKRQDMLEEFFAQIPQQRQHRLRGLQFRIDMERRRAKSPMGACIKISAMMWDSVGGKDGLIDSIKKLSLPASEVTAKAPRLDAKILSFRKTN